MLDYNLAITELFSFGRTIILILLAYYVGKLQVYKEVDNKLKDITKLIEHKVKYQHDLCKDCYEKVKKN